ncbi:MAG: glycoside hydrolase family 9 protein [Fimbriimonas sp.]|nr:glycoside hydrolase family 9 protein [Fimbriimonas sp.]
MIAFISLSMLALARSGDSHLAQNLVPNPHFAIGDSVPDGWTSIYTAKGKLVAGRDTKIFVHPPASLSLTGTTDDADGNVSAELPDVSGKTLTIDGSVRCGGGVTAAQIALFLQDESYKQLEYRPLVDRFGFKDGVWTQFHVTAEVPANAKHARLILLEGGKGTVWLGEISVTDAGAETKRATATLTPPTVPPTVRTAQSPRLTSIGAIAPDVLDILIQDGRTTPSSMTVYAPKPGDERLPKGHQQILKRNGQEIGWLIGARHDHLVSYEQLVGDPLQPEYAGYLGTYRVSSPDDLDYQGGKQATALFRKSKPNDWEIPRQRFAWEHRIYLKLPSPLKEGKTYTVDFGKLNVQPGTSTFVFRPAAQASEAIHVSQVGYRPDDPFKRAYLSCWRGTGGGQEYDRPMTFRIVDASTGATALSGPVRLGKSASEPEHMVREENFVRADVYWMDFTRLTKPGTYRVVVDGVGCSYPFPIAADVWDQAFKVQMRGLVNERAGIALKPPYADFVRPPDEMPNEGQQITESTSSVLNGQEAWTALVKGDTGQPVKGAYGGYHDAGDWNPRRATHLKVTMAHLEMLDIFPDHFAKMRLGLPDSSNLPDVLQEALWEIDLFRRLQKPDGGVPFGLETDGDPEDGDVSWLTTMHLYEFAPDCYSSWTYASAAARAARIMSRYDAAKSRGYAASAVKAMEWGEAHMAEERPKLTWEMTDARNLAAVEIYWLTHDPKWHEVFLQDTLLKTSRPYLFQYGKAVQRDAAFVYARLPQGLGEATYKQNAVDGLEIMAKKCLEYATGNAFNLTNCDKGRPLGFAFYTEADATDLCRAHFFTHKSEYLAGIVTACQFATGANPSNLVYTTGLGANPIQHPLLLDSRRTGQPAPKGLTVFGPIDYVQFHDDGTIWPMKFFLNQQCIPPSNQWPIPEAYFDIYLYPIINEFTVDTWAGNLYAWGYLAARK